MLPPKIFMLKMPAFTPALREEMRTQRVYQDIVLPLSALESSVRAAGDEFEIWPILVYPSLVVDHGEGRRGVFPTRAVRSAPPADKSDFHGRQAALFFDLGVYGIPRQVRERLAGYSGVQSLRKMERFTTSVGGAPFLYADTFMSPEEFEKTFDLDLYRRCRSKYGAEGAFFDLYEKTTSYRKGDELL
jgi:delta24-sterol reductase